MHQNKALCKISLIPVYPFLYRSGLMRILAFFHFCLILGPGPWWPALEKHFNPVVWTPEITYIPTLPGLGSKFAQKSMISKAKNSNFHLLKSFGGVGVLWPPAMTKPLEIFMLSKFQFVWDRNEDKIWKKKSGARGLLAVRTLSDLVIWPN